MGHWSDLWYLFADGDLTWFLHPDIRGGESFVLCGAVIDKMSIELWARAWPVCGKSDKEAAPRVQRAITQLPGGEHGCTGVYSWGVYYPTDPPIQNLHNPHPFAYLHQWQKLSLFLGPMMAFPMILNITWVPHLLLRLGPWHPDSCQMGNLTPYYLSQRLHMTQAAPDDSKMVWNFCTMAPCRTMACTLDSKGSI